MPFSSPSSLVNSGGIVRKKMVKTVYEREIGRGNRRHQSHAGKQVNCEWFNSVLVSNCCTLRLAENHMALLCNQSVMKPKQF